MNYLSENVTMFSGVHGLILLFDIVFIVIFFVVWLYPPKIKPNAHQSQLGTSMYAVLGSVVMVAVFMLLMYFIVKGSFLSSPSLFNR